MFPILENLRGFFSSRPPLVVFMICLGSFAIALITFAYIVRVKDNIHNPDVKMDWNTFLDRFSKLEMCLSGNRSDFTNSSGARVPLADMTQADIYQNLHEIISKTINLPAVGVSRRELTLTDRAHSSPSVRAKRPSLSMSRHASSSSTSSPTQSNQEDYENFLNVTIAMNVDVTLTPTSKASSISGSTQYISLITGQQMKLHGKIQESEFAATFTFPFNLTSGTCKEWSGKSCMRHSVTVCVNFQGPADLFPKTETPSSSSVCINKHNGMADTFTLRTLTSQVKGEHVYWCHKGIHIQPSFNFDDSLTVLLSLEDRSVINLHLMRTSYFLFVLVVTFFCYAMIKGRPVKSKASHIPYIEKISTHG